MKIDVKVPCGKRGDWEVSEIEVTKEDAEFANLRAFITRSPFSRVVPGIYKRLTRGRVVVMSNTPMEILTNMPFINASTGDVLINGLGLGVVLTAILDKPTVNSITVIEKHQEVIDLVAPSFKSKKLKVIHADALDFKPVQRFSTVWHDIWDNICTDNLPEMHKLHRKYGRHCDWQGSWAREICERKR